jgi:hypothetical protein
MVEAATSLRPMSTFDPNEPAVLNDRTNNSIYTWTGEHAEDFERIAKRRADGLVEWRNCVFDGWGNVLGG